MAYTFIKAKDGQTGASKVETEKLTLANRLMSEAAAQGVNLYLPQDSMAADAFSASAFKEAMPSDRIAEGWMGLDIGPQAVDHYSRILGKSQNILWNGPMGVFEFEPFKAGSKAIAEAIAEAADQGSFTLIGGGDSVAAVNEFNMGHRLSFISTGGGAMLEYLEGKPLPGLKAIQANAEALV